MSIRSFDDVRLSLRCRPINKLQVRRTSLPYSEFFTPKFTELQKTNPVACGKWKVGPLNFMLDYCKVLGTSQRPQPKGQSKAQRGEAASLPSYNLQVNSRSFPSKPLSMESSSQLSLRLVAQSASPSPSMVGTSASSRLLLKLVSCYYY